MTRRVKDVLTPLGATPHPPRSLALVAEPFANPQATAATAHPQIPHAREALLKEWQNIALCMEFSVRPHQNHFVHSWGHNCSSSSSKATETD